MTDDNRPVNISMFPCKNSADERPSPFVPGLKSCCWATGLRFQAVLVCGQALNNSNDSHVVDTVRPLVSFF